MRSALAGRGDNLVVIDSIDSTHHLARRLIDQVDAEDVPLRPTVIVAERQTRGCGRGSRQWKSPEGGLYLSWASSDIEPATVPLLPVLAASAAQRSLAAIGIPGTKIKWPNDLLYDGRKLAGLIIHARHGERVLVTVGLGVNIEVSPALEVDAIIGATSVGDILGPGLFEERAAFIAAHFVHALSEAISDPGPAVEHWTAHLVHEVGDPINVRLSSGDSVAGVFAGVTEQGYLRVAGPDGETTLTGGDVIEG